MAVSKVTLMEDMFKTVKDRMADNVTTVTLASTATTTIQTYSSSFPDKQIDDKSSYPILIINPVETSWEDFTFTKKYAEGTFTIDIYTTNSEASDLFLDAIVNSIETYRDDFYALGVYMVNLQSTNSDSVIRGGFKVHTRSCTFTFRKYFTRTFP